MGIIKVSLFQKSLSEGLNLSTLKRLAALKSDFLILPEYFYADSKTSKFQNLKDKQQHTIDWLTRLNEAYGGVVIAGSVFREQDGIQMISAPVLSDGQIVDCYYKQNLTVPEQEIASAGKELATFILGGQRFAILLGDEIYDSKLTQQLEDEAIKLVFTPSMFNNGKNSEAEMAADEKQLVAIAQKHNLHIVRCCPIGTFMGHAVKGRSVVVNPDGVSWRISYQEENQEMLKTVMLTLNTL